MASERKHASFRHRSQSDNGNNRTQPLSAARCISLWLTQSGAALTSFLLWAAAHQLDCKGGVGASWPSQACGLRPCVCPNWEFNDKSAAFLIWEVS